MEPAPCCLSEEKGRTGHREKKNSKGTAGKVKNQRKKRENNVPIPVDVRSTKGKGIMN